MRRRGAPAVKLSLRSAIMWHVRLARRRAGERSRIGAGR